MLGGLTHGQLVEAATQAEQLLKGALLDYAPFVQYEYKIATSDRR